ncbi:MULTISPECIES: hypothetical protein [unclassified Herbaspirillum]|uniref:hypothetical protein n=1 Tax=unclassified Herbaspirillum TaxID=2624150 RepID=UPI00161BB34A|nr:MULTISPECIES: hypothetical protein [unclassified Herbaspirillum]MBB5391383.1 hypothetical protein [Herbaspirillum sp. SJZ102]
MNMASATLFNLLSNGVSEKEIPPFRFRTDDRASRRTATFTWRSVRRQVEEGRATWSGA